MLLTATNPPHLTTSAGITLLGTAGVQQWHAAVHTLLVAGSPPATAEALPTAFCTLLVTMTDAVRLMGSVCVGAFALAKAGILVGRRATTYWAF